MEQLVVELGTNALPTRKDFKVGTTLLLVSH